MNDMRTKQWFIKVRYNGRLIEVREVWSDTQQMAQIHAHKHATSSLDTQMETSEETKTRFLKAEYEQLRRDNDSLEEYLFDDYGDTVEQIGLKKANELEVKYSQQQERLRQLSELLR